MQTTWQSNHPTKLTEDGIYIRKKGFEFAFDPGACAYCPGHCCRGASGYIWVNQQEILQICGFLELDTIDFIQKYLNRIGNKFSIKERVREGDFQCVFFDDLGHRCTVYSVRPLQCRQYPFWEHFRRHKDQAVRECPGIKVEV